MRIHDIVSHLVHDKTYEDPYNYILDIMRLSYFFFMSKKTPQKTVKELNDYFGVEISCEYKTQNLL